MPSDPLIGRTLDGYKIDKLLGRGGMARVYRAIDPQLDRYVAVKIIDPHSSRNNDYRERFRTEARAIAGLRHPNIVGIYRFGDIDGLYYMAMEYVDGSDLRWVLDEYRKRGELMPYNSMYKIMDQIAKALDAAHKQGVIHRDVKPSNIMINSSGDAILTDFGLALMTAEGTRGDVFGSPYYIAPEQAMTSSGAVPQSDQYALGVTLYEILVGRVPYDQGTPMQIAMAHLSDTLPDPHKFNPSLHPSFVNVLQIALSKDPENRYPSGAKFSAALRSAVTDARKAGSMPPKIRSTASTPDAGLQLSQVEISEKVKLYREDNPLTSIPNVTGVDIKNQRIRRPNAKPSHVKPVVRRKRRSPFAALVLILLIVSVAGVGMFIATNPELLAEIRGNLPAAVGGPIAVGTTAVEGVVSAIEDDTLLIYDVEIRVPRDAIILQRVKTGDLVRLEGEYHLETDGSVTMITISKTTLNYQQLR